MNAKLQAAIDVMLADDFVPARHWSEKELEAEYGRAPKRKRRRLTARQAEQAYLEQFRDYCRGV